jgi:hypothetical protein
MNAGDQRVANTAQSRNSSWHNMIGTQIHDWSQHGTHHGVGAAVRLQPGHNPRFRLVADIHLSTLGALYWQSQMRNARCHILKMSVNKASTVWVVAYLVITASCRSSCSQRHDWPPRWAKMEYIKGKTLIPNKSILQAAKHAKTYNLLLKTWFWQDTIEKLQNQEPDMNLEMDPLGELPTTRPIQMC